jgi:hypothetical protein
VRSKHASSKRQFGDHCCHNIFAGLCIGHLHVPPDDSHLAAIGRIDILMVPIDGTYTMSMAFDASGR